MREKIEDFYPGEVYYVADYDCYVLVYGTEVVHHPFVKYYTNEDGGVIQKTEEVAYRMVDTVATQMKKAPRLERAMGKGDEPSEGEYFEVVNNGISYKFGYRYYRNFVENNSIDKGLGYLSDEPVFVLQPSELYNFMEELRRYEQAHSQEGN